MPSTERDSMAVMDTRGVTTLVSDSGVTRYRIEYGRVAGLWPEESSLLGFWKGGLFGEVRLIFQVEASIKADTAYFLYKEELWKLIGNVHIQNLKGEQFQYRAAVLGPAGNKESIQISLSVSEQPDRIITGHGFESNQQMTVYTIRQAGGYLLCWRKGELPQQTACRLIP